jgi:inner membrane protein
MIGSLFRFISVPLERKYGHRTITHSLIGWIVSTVICALFVLFGILIFGFISNFGFRPCLPAGRISDFTPSGVEGLSWRWIVAFSISYLSHLLLDMLNPRGSQLFWPDPSRDVIPRNPKFRPESGSKVEVFILILFVILMFLALPISKYGIGSSLRWLLATPGAAIEEFKSYKNHAYLEFDGIFNETREPVKGTSEILDVDNQRLVILYNGKIYTLSDELAADILASHVRVKRTTVPVQIITLNFKDESIDSLLAKVTNKALIFGTVHLPEGMEIKFPLSQSMFKTMDQSGNNLILRYASKKDIRSLGLNEFFDIQIRKDRAELSKLETDKVGIQDQIKHLEGEGLTPLGQELLASNKQDNKQKMDELKSRLEQNRVAIDEIKLKIEKRKFVFSGEVNIRQ